MVSGALQKKKKCSDNHALIDRRYSIDGHKNISSSVLSKTDKKNYDRRTQTSNVQRQ